MQLSERLTTVAQFVTKGNRVADIGCDHAHTSIYLVEHGIAKSAIAMDINQGPLERAKENIRRYGYADRITTRLSDGARELFPGEADTLLMSGMGGILMNRILSDSLSVVKNVKELVLQPQSELALVRKYIHEIGFSITEEAMLIEDEKYYTVLKAVNLKEKGSHEAYDKEIFYRYGKLLLENQNPVLKQFLEYGKASYHRIISEISGQTAQKTVKRCQQLKEELVLIDEALAYYQSLAEREKGYGNNPR